ncbi:hypothetical protein QJS04_geneDACA001333 [Acorus gramineus]|uniref:Uncharacterized protein n=1 Tax=Acorus gramineus TaxID=55184 RepID=A0AAV9AF12_ACOGR|nr:hypothetical protein QJS04_geneDACA001333 [Acorus gramineus]
MSDNQPTWRNIKTKTTVSITGSPLGDVYSDKGGLHSEDVPVTLIELGHAWEIYGSQF